MARSIPRQIGRGLLIALAILWGLSFLLSVTGCRKTPEGTPQDPNCPPGYECPLPDLGSDYCPGCDLEQKEEVIEIEVDDD